jgi:hypothetical protein
MVYVEPEQLRALRAEAKAQGISSAERMRRLVQQHLDARQGPSPVPREAYLTLVGLGASGRTDIAERHDRYLGEALRDEHAR